MPRKKKVEVDTAQEIIRGTDPVEVPVEKIDEPVMLSTNDIVVPVEMIWVETVDSTGRHMIQVPKY